MHVKYLGRRKGIRDATPKYLLASDIMNGGVVDVVRLASWGI